MLLLIFSSGASGISDDMKFDRKRFDEVLIIRLRVVSFIRRRLRFVTASSAFIPGSKLPGRIASVRFLSIESRLSMA